MEEKSSEDSTLVLDSDIAGFNIMDPDIDLIHETSDFSRRACATPRSLEELAGQSADLMKNATNLTMILNEQGNMRFDADLRREILEIFCRFASLLVLPTNLSASDLILKQENANLRHRLALQELDIKQKEKLMDTSSAELTNSQLRLVSMKRKIEQKDHKLADLRRTIRAQEEKIATLESEKVPMERNDNVNPKQHERMEKALINLSKQYENQSLTLARVLQLNVRARDALTRQAKVIDAYEEQIKRLEETHRSITNGVSDLENELGETRKQLEMTQEELKSERQSFIERSFSESPSRITGPGDKLMRVVNGMLQFLVQLANYDSENLRFFDLNAARDESIKRTINGSVALVKQFIRDNGLDGEVADADDLDIEAVNKESLAAMNFVLLKFCERSKEERSVLQSLRERLHFRGNDREMISLVVDQKAGIERFVRDAMKAIRESVSENSLGILLKYLRESSSVIKSLCGVLGFTGDIKDLPRAVEKAIVERNTEKDAEATSKIGELETKVASLEATLKTKDEELSSLDEKIVAMEQIRCEEKRDMEIKLRQSLLSQRNTTSLSVEFDTQESNDEVLRLRNEVESLKALLDERAKRFEMTIAQTLELERQKQQSEHEIEVQEVQSRELEMKETNVELKKKLRDARREMKEIIDSFSVTSSKQNEVIAKLKEKNDDLRKRIKKLKENRRFEIPKEKLLTLESEKRSLEVQLANINDKYVQMQTSRENYWKTEIERVETELRKSNAENIRVEKEYRHRLIQRLMEIVRGSVPVVQDISETSLFAGVRYLAQQNQDYEMQLRSLQTILLRNETQPIPEDESFDWRNWAENLYEASSRSISREKTDMQIRDYLSDVVLGSVSSQMLAEKVENLKSQKRILQQLPTTFKSHSICDFRSVLLVSMAIVRIRKKAGYSTL